jgi:hypothetical protein
MQRGLSKRPCLRDPLHIRHVKLPRLLCSALPARQLQATVARARPAAALSQQRQGEGAAAVSQPGPRRRRQQQGWKGPGQQRAGPAMRALLACLPAGLLFFQQGLLPGSSIWLCPMLSVNRNAHIDTPRYKESHTHHTHTKHPPQRSLFGVCLWQPNACCRQCWPLFCRCAR